MSTVAPMKNMAEVIHWIEAKTPFTDAFRKKVLGSVRRMPRIPSYGIPLEQVPADLGTFDKVWGRGPVRALPAGFKTKGSFSDWRSQVRSALTAFLDLPNSDVPDVPADDWAQILSDLEAAGDPTKKLIAVKVLANAARNASLTPSEVSRAQLQDLVDASDMTGRYRSIQAALKYIHQNRSAILIVLSPALDGTPIQKSRQYCVRAELPPPLAKEIEGWVSRRVRGEPKGHRKKRKSKCTPKRAADAVRGVTYVYTAMLTAGIIEAGPLCSVADLADPTLLEDIIERELNGDFPWAPLAPTTLFEYVSNWKLFVRGSGLDAKPLTEVISDFTAFENVKGMSSGRRDWCEDFLHDHRKQSTFLGLPNALVQAAKKAMLTYETGSQHQKDAAIALSLAACAAAIWTSLPLRISTLLNLSYGGEEADVQLHKPGRGLVLTTPPDIVKNGYSHRYITLTPKKGGDPRAIVAWFVEKVRPKLLKAHIEPHLQRPDLLFGGASYARMSGAWRQKTLEAGVPMTPHQVRHALATLMANQPGADFSIIAALLGDTEATVRKNYVFVDQARKHEEGQKILAQIQGHVLMQGAA